MLPRRQAGLKIFTDGEARRGPVGRRRRAFQKIWSMHLHFAIWNFLLPDQPKSPSTAEKPCLNFFSCCPGSTVTTWESLCTLGPVAVATGGPMLSFRAAVPLNPIWACSKWGPVSSASADAGVRRTTAWPAPRGTQLGHGYGTRGCITPVGRLLRPDVGASWRAYPTTRACVRTPKPS